MEGLKFTEDHEWVKVEDGVAIIGITDFAQGELGDIVYVEGDENEPMNQGDVAGSIEAVKTVSDIFAPVSGEIIEINESLEDNPDLVNSDPYGEGWIMKIKMSNESEVDSLMTEEEYQAII